MTILSTPIWQRHDCALTLGHVLACLVATPVFMFALAVVLALGGE